MELVAHQYPSQPRLRLVVRFKCLPLASRGSVRWSHLHPFQLVGGPETRQLVVPLVLIVMYAVWRSDTAPSGFQPISSASQLGRAVRRNVCRNEKRVWRRRERSPSVISLITWGYSENDSIRDENTVWCEFIPETGE
jgi:hypothetical protein